MDDFYSTCERCAAKDDCPAGALPGSVTCLIKRAQCGKTHGEELRENRRRYEMGGTMRKIKRGLKRHPRRKTVEYDTEILVHGRMVYECERCGRRWNMYLEKGIEEPGNDHKPSPYIIQCPNCGGFAKDISGIIGFAGGGYYPLPAGESYFANKKDYDCGVPILN